MYSRFRCCREHTAPVSSADTASWRISLLPSSCISKKLSKIFSKSLTGRCPKSSSGGYPKSPGHQLHKSDAVRERARCSHGNSEMRSEREHGHLAQTARCAPRDVLSQTQWMRFERELNALTVKGTHAINTEHCTRGLKGTSKLSRKRAINTMYCTSGFEGASKVVSNSRHQYWVLYQRFQRGPKSGLELCH